MTESASQSSEASLLSLPRELRLRIYEHVLLLDINHVAVTQWRGTHTPSYGFRSYAELNKDEDLAIHWVNLMLSCKTIAVELRALMREHSWLEDEQNRTYVLDMEATRGGKALGRTTWRRLPCAPEHAQYLEAYYNANRGFRAWGDGGPHRIVSGLYQALNHLVHCGPRFDSKFELPTPMHLKRLRVVIESRAVEAGKDEHAHYLLYDSPKTTMIALGSIVGQINHTGVLRSFVDRIEVSDGHTVLHWLSEESENTGFPGSWDGYGFDWGMEVYRESKAVPDHAER